MKSGRYLNSVRCALPESAQAYLDRAFTGDALAARRLMIMAPRRLRGHIACLAYQSKIRNPAYREIVRAVWAHETRHLLTAFWAPQMVRRMLARADFPIPELSGPVTIFRPVSGAPVKKAAAGLCWTLSREVAVSDAARAGTEKPRILQATIDPADIIYWGNGRGEQEIVARRPVHPVVVESPSRIRGASTQIVEADRPRTSRHR
jgi:hypothetical protein